MPLVKDRGVLARFEESKKGKSYKHTAATCQHQ